MLEIASVVLAVVAVLFGVCLTIFIKSYQKYTNDDDDYEPEERPEKRRKKQGEGTDRAANPDRPKKTGVTERSEQPERREKPAERPKAANLEKSEKAVKVEKVEKAAEATASEKTGKIDLAKLREKPSKPAGNNEAAAANTGQPKPVMKETAPAKQPEPTVRDTGSAEQPRPAQESARQKDISDTRISSPDEIRKLRDAAQDPAPKNTSRFRLRTPEEPVPVNDAPEEDQDEDSGIIKFRPAIIGASALAAVLIVAVLVVVFVRGRDRKAEPRLPETVAVTVQDIQLQETLNGKVTSPDVITTMFAATGKVTGLKVKEGDYVSKGNTIYTVDSSNLQARIDLLEERIASLSSSSSTSTRTETTRANITASAGGTVTALRVDSGDTVSTGDIVAEITVPATNQVTVVLKNRISVGQSVSVYSNGATTQGTVRSVSQISAAPADPENGENDEDSDTESVSGSDTGTSSESSGSGSSSANTGSDDKDTDADTQSGTQSETQTGAQSGSQSENQSNTQTGTQSGNQSETQPNNQTGGSGQDDSKTPQPMWSAVISFSSTTAAGSTATVAVNGERVSGNVTKGRTSIVSLSATSGGKISFRVGEGDRVNSGSIIATVENQRQVAGTSSGGSSNSYEAREARLELEQLETELENYTVKATVDGYVQKLFLKEGDTAAVGMNAVVVIPATSLMLAVEMDASLAAGLEVPLAVTYKMIRSSNFDSSVWEELNTTTNQIASIENLVPSESNPDKYIGYITLEDPSLYRDGMMADVNIVSYYAPHAVTVPQELVKDGKVSILREGGQVTEVPVRTGAVTKDGYIEILDGLSSGDRVVTGQGGAQ